MDPEIIIIGTTETQFKVVVKWKGHKPSRIPEWRHYYILWSPRRARFTRFSACFLKCALTFGRYDYIMYLA